MSASLPDPTPAVRDLPRDAWDARIAEAGISDIYYSSAWVESAAVIEGGAPARLHLRGPGGDVFFPCLVRPLPAGLGEGFDVTSPYGYGGPLAAGADPPVRAFHEAYEAWARERGVVTTFIRYHPLFRTHAYAPAHASVEPLAGTVAWRLGGGRDLMAGMCTDYRRRVREGARRGITVSVERAPALAGFRRLYEQTMTRNEANDFYHFPDPYWEALPRLFGERLILFEARFEGEVVAANLTVGAPPWLHGHLAGSSDLGRTLRATRVSCYEGALWAQRDGFELLHMGGGVGGTRDELFEYKRRFDEGGVLPAFIGKVVHDRARYRELSGSDDTSGFFPMYRRAAAPAREEAGAEGGGEERRAA
jgi:hypothetical protein